MTKLEEIENLLNVWALKNDFREEFPCDYQDTFDVGIEQGRIDLARDILSILKNEDENGYNSR